MVSKLRALVSAVELGSLKAAAETLGCTQSAVSHSIASLETELGFRLLRRDRSGVKLTDEGERLLPYARGLLSAEEQLRQTAASIRSCSSCSAAFFSSIRIPPADSSAISLPSRRQMAFGKAQPSMPAS